MSVRSVVVGAARLVVSAMAAGAVVGLVEGTRLWWSAGGGAAAMVLAVGLCAVGGAVPGLVLLAGARAAARLSPCARWLADLAEPGARRAGAIVRGAVAIAAVAALGAVALFTAMFTHDRFRAAGAVGLLHAAVMVTAAAGLAIAGGWSARAGVRLLAGRRWLHWLSTGWIGRLALVALAVATALAAVGIARAAAPAADTRPLLLALGWVAVLVAIGRSDPFRRGRSAAVAAVVVGGATVAALAGIGSFTAARQAIAGHGVASAAVLGGLWHLADGDGDGYAARFGGTDCNDGDAAVSPVAREIPGNGVDENCAGGDLDLADLSPRTEAQPSRYKGRARHNVLLVSIDTVRADHASAYGYGRDTTPALAALAARGTLFEWAISPSPTTRRAIPAIMAGRYATTLAFVESAQHWPPTLVPGRHRLLGTAFRRAGYQTLAALCCKTLFDAKAGVVEGFDQVDASAAASKGKDNDKREYTADLVTDRAIALLRARDPARPFVMWVHYLDPHNPYVAIPGAPDYGKEPIDRYDSEIRYTDDQLARLLAALRADGLEDTTIVAVTADHGEEFYEHGNHYHGRSLYNELTRVPLVIAIPGGKARRVGEPVSLIDVGATLLDLVGVDRPAGQNGRSLAPAIVDGQPAPDRVVLAELIADRNIKRNLRAGFYRDWKIIQDLDVGTYELYSLSRDPTDTHDVRARSITAFEDMERRLRIAVDVELTALPGEPRGNAR